MVEYLLDLARRRRPILHLVRKVDRKDYLNARLVLVSRFWVSVGDWQHKFRQVSEVGSVPFILFSPQSIGGPFKEVRVGAQSVLAQRKHRTW